MTVSDYLLTAFRAARDARNAIPAKCHDCHVPKDGLPSVCIEHRGEYQDAYVAADRLWDVFWDEHESTTDHCYSEIGCCDVRFHLEDNR